MEVRERGKTVCEDRVLGDLEKEKWKGAWEEEDERKKGQTRC